MDIKRLANQAGSALGSMLTSKDNSTVDVIRVAIFVATAAAVAFTGYDLIALRHAFNCVDFGGGIAAITGGGGLGILAKRRDEPNA